MLVDAGAESHTYAADITRTFPANGKFSEDQRTIYQMVLGIQKKLIKEVKPGVKFRGGLTAICDRLICEAGVKVRNSVLF